MAPRLFEKMGSQDEAQRGPRSSPQQKTALIDHMHANIDFAQGKLDTELGQYEWDKLARTLNSLPGCKKTVGLWQRSWADIKQRAKSKANALKDAKMRTGNWPIEKGMELDEADIKVLAVVGPVTIDGIPGSMDSLPQSQAAIIRLMHGDRSVTKETEPGTELFGCGAGSQSNRTSESHGAARMQLKHEVADTENEEEDSPTISPSRPEPATSSSSRRASSLKNSNRGADAMLHRLKYEEKTEHFAKMQEKQVEAITMMAQAQLLQAQNQAAQIDLQRDTAAEFKKIRIEFQKMTSHLGKIVDCMTANKKNE